MSRHTRESEKGQHVKHIVTNPRSRCWCPNSSAFILRTWEKVLGPAHSISFRQTQQNLYEAEKLHTHTTLSCREKVEEYGMSKVYVSLSLSTYDVRNTRRRQHFARFKLHLCDFNSLQLLLGCGERSGGGAGGHVSQVSLKAHIFLRSEQTDRMPLVPTADGD